MAIVSYKCPNCGGEVAFNPASQKYHCEYCVSDFTEEEVQLIQNSQNPLVYNCPSCGAQIITDDTTAATFCYYCHNPVILSGKLEGNYLPDKIVPFEVTKEEATHIFEDWIKSKKYVPKSFFSKEQIEKISGVYFPYWLMDCDVNVEAIGKATNLKVWMVGDLEYTETSFYEIERKGSIHFEDLNKNALQKANKKLVEGVMPFKTLEIKPFSMSYLSGFQAEKRDMEQQDLQQDMDDEMRKYADIIVKESVQGYATLSMDQLQLEPQKKAWEYVLLPVWVLTYNQAGKMYYYALNGQTKKVCGELPIDKKKLFFHCISLSLILFFILMIGGWFIW
ncbi:TFIIB-type zinc ribbon-containing protein [Lachnospiraceae bacterium LCP25S3_G4]